MSKYDALWDYVGRSKQSSIQLTFEEIHAIAGLEIDHSFLTFKRDLRRTAIRSAKSRSSSRPSSFSGSNRRCSQNTRNKTAFSGCLFV